MELWELMCEHNKKEKFGPVGGAPSLGFMETNAESIKAAKKMTSLYDHLLPKVDLNHNGSVDDSEIDVLSNASKLDPDTRKLVSFLQEAREDIRFLRMPGTSMGLDVKKGDMQKMVRLLSCNGGLGVEAYDRCVAGIKGVIKEQEPKAGAGLYAKALAFAKQEGIKFAALGAVQNECDSQYQELRTKVDHLRSMLTADSKGSESQKKN